MNGVSILLLVLSIGAHLLLLVDVDPSRETCTGVRDETVLTALLNGLTFLTGACCMWIPYGNFIVVSLSALTTVFASRLTLYVHEIRSICAADITKAPADDILRDVDVYDRAAMLAWAGLALFALGVLLAHTKLKCNLQSLFDQGGRRERCPERLPVAQPYRDDCNDCGDSKDKQTTWIRIAQ